MIASRSVQRPSVALIESEVLLTVIVLARTEPAAKNPESTDAAKARGRHAPRNRHTTIVYPFFPKEIRAGVT